jgi:two-component system response regulator TctD
MRLLLVEDTDDVANAVVSVFARSGHAVDHVMTCMDAEEALAVQAYDLVILDINLPDGSGIDILRGARARKLAAPILMLTARLDVEDRIEALDIGADDYLMKPFDLRELEARVRALLRRGADERNAQVEYGDLVLDPAGRTAECNGEALQLTRREFALLEVMMANRGRVLAKERIFNSLFAFEDGEVGLNAVELYIARLRRKLSASQVSIRTLRGLGYQLYVGETD